MLLTVALLTNALVVPPAPVKHSNGGIGSAIAAVCAAAVIASVPTPTNALPVPSVLVAAEDADAAAIKAAKAQAKAQSAQLARDDKAAADAAKAKAKALAARGAPAKMPAASSTDLSIGLRSGIVPNIKDRVPSSIGLTLPGLGPVRVDLSVAVSKVTAEEAADADIVVSLPKDLIKAGKLAVGGDAGVAFDVPGLVGGRLDVDLVTPRKGEADIAVTSSLLPKLPLQKTKGLGRFCFECGNGGQQSDWFVARNLGNGIQFYGNAKTGVSQFEVPKGF